jgi:hypothetical protein
VATGNEHRGTGLAFAGMYWSSFREQDHAPRGRLAVAQQPRSALSGRQTDLVAVEDDPIYMAAIILGGVTWVAFSRCGYTAV